MNEIVDILKHTISETYSQDVEVVLTRPEPQFGDFSTNVALQLAKKIGVSPRELAEKLAASLEQNQKILKVDVAGPGFINITLTDSSLLELLDQKQEEKTEKDSVVIETNNPNPFKAMHIGHAFNAILADSIANLLEKRGDKIYRVSYHGDVGLHVGKSMYSLLKYIDGNIEKLHEIDEKERNSFMSKMYAEGSTAYKENEEAKKEINELAEQSFSPKSQLYHDVYELCKEWSFQDIDKLVARLGNKPTERRFLESDADARGVKVVKDNTPAVFYESDGAYVFAGSKYGAFDNVFVGSNGRGLYAARDLGLIQLKNEYYHPKKSYIVTAEEQRAYFTGVIAAAELCFPDQKDVTINIPHGIVKLSTGKMSSRDGDVVEVAWLFEKISEAVSSRGSEVSEDIVVGAIRYQFLKVKVGSDVVFDIESAVSISGESGPYLQYAHARACSILQKSNVEKAQLHEPKFDEYERRLLQKLTQYQEIVERAGEELAPHHIAHYLFELCSIFNTFYESSKVVGDPREQLRILLVEKYAETLRSGLELLGIPAPEKV